MDTGNVGHVLHTDRLRVLLPVRNFLAGGLIGAAIWLVVFLAMK